MLCRAVLRYVCCDMNVLCGQEGTLSAFNQWRAAASNSDLAGFLADTALVRSSLANISKQQASAAQLAKAIADKTEAGAVMPCDSHDSYTSEAAHGYKLM